MQDAMTFPATLVDRPVHSHETRQQSTPSTAPTGDAQRRRVRPGWPVKARNLHAGDVVPQFDWPLHVHEVTLSPAAVTVALTEFEFPLHYPADAQVQLAA
jgi:hypothetical protein